MSENVTNDDFSLDRFQEEFEAIADGLYVGTIRNVEVKPIVSGGDAILLSIDIEYKGITRSIEKKYNVISRQAQGFFIKEMKKLGLQVMKREDTVNGLSTLVGVKAKWKAATNADGFQCWYVLEKIDENAEPAPMFSW